MLVPMELHSLIQRKGYLSPELAIGWQIGKYVSGFFDGLAEVEIAAASDNDATMALSHLTRQHGYPGRIVVPETARTWDFLFYHLTTGTMMGFTLIRPRIQLPQKIRDLEATLSAENIIGIKLYQAALDVLVKSLFLNPVPNFTQIQQIRCRRLNIYEQTEQQILCQRCNQRIPACKAWDIEGEICCPSCSGLEPDWYTFH